MFGDRRFHGEREELVHANVHLLEEQAETNHPHLFLVSSWMPDGHIRDDGFRLFLELQISGWTMKRNNQFTNKAKSPSA